MRLTDLSIRSLPVPPDGQVTHTDDVLAGFGIRVSQGGTKTFVLVHGPRRERVSLGRYPIISLSQAREKAKVILAERTLGQGRVAKVRFDDAKTAFLEDCKRKNRSRTVNDYGRLLSRHFPFGRTLIDDISRLEITGRLDRLADTPAEQNYAFRVIRRFFNFCVQRGHLTTSPCAGMTAPSRTSPRTRVLSDAELKSIWLACERPGESTNLTALPNPERLELPKHFPEIVKLLILTGQRRGEIAALRIEYCTLEPASDQPAGAPATISLPAEITKNGRAHRFPIGDMAQEILRTVGNGSVEPMLFPARGKKDQPFNGWSKGKTALDETSGVTGWTLHDLRRTFRTNLSKLGVAPHIAERLVNHVSARSEMELVYDQHTYMPEMQRAVALWEGQVAKILGR